MGKKTHLSTSWRPSRFIPAFVGAGLLAMTQVGSSAAEANFCSYIPNASDTCLRGIPPEVIEIGAAVLILSSFGWFLWSPINDLIKNPWRVMMWWRRARATIRKAQMWPIIGMIVGGLLFVGCAAWLFAKNSASVAEIQESLQRYVLPQHLTEKQMAIIGDYLRQCEPQTVKMAVLENSEEASQYRADIQQALTHGGWQVSAIQYSSDIREDVTTHFIQAQETRQRRHDPNHPKVDELFREATRRAGIQLQGHSGSGGKMWKLMSSQ